MYVVQDEKLQNILGHFQKEFEGGVSAENLGKGTKAVSHLLRGATVVLNY